MDASARRGCTAGGRSGGSTARGHWAGRDRAASRAALQGPSMARSGPCPRRPRTLQRGASCALSPAVPRARPVKEERTFNTSSRARARRRVEGASVRTRPQHGRARCVASADRRTQAQADQVLGRQVPRMTDRQCHLPSHQRKCEENRTDQQQAHHMSVVEGGEARRRGVLRRAFPDSRRRGDDRAGRYPTAIGAMN